MQVRRSANGGVVRVIATLLVTMMAMAPSTVSAQLVAPAPPSIAAIAVHDTTASTALPDMQLPAPQPAAPEATSPSEPLTLWQFQSPSEPATRERFDVRSRSEIDRPLIAEVAKRIVLDPTTYLPAAIVYSSLHLDWRSSQPLFRAGYVEAHPGYTMNGLPYDAPVSYAEGRQRNVDLALRLLGRSVANNAVSALVEHALIERAPNHRKLIRVLGWIERTAFASYFSYVLSEQHFEQWRKNDALARQVGAR